MSRVLFSRRAALLQLASIPITLSLARALRADSPVGPKRLVILMTNNGTKRNDFWPARPAPDAGEYPIAKTPILDALFTNDDGSENGLRAKANLVRGLNVTGNVANNGNEHDLAFARMFTGAQLMPTPDGAPWAGAASIDQVLARDWDVQSLTTAVYASEVEDHPKAGLDHRASFSYLDAQKLNLPIIDPVTAYQEFFPQGEDPPGQRLLLRKSVLDAVSGDLREISGRLGADDARKLDAHLSAVRDAENRLSDLVANHAMCRFGVAAPRDFKNVAPGYADNLLDLETYVPDMIDAFTALIGAALKCGMTRVASLQLGYGGGKWKFGWRNIGIDHHGSIAHLDHTDDAGSTPDQIQTSARVTAIDQYYMSVMRKLALDLDGATEGAGTVLDNTLVIFAHEFGRGDHQLTDIPVILLGLVGNGVSRGGLVRDVFAAHGGAYQAHNLIGYHALNALGHATPGFGDIADLSAAAIEDL